MYKKYIEGKGTSLSEEIVKLKSQIESLEKAIGVLKADKLNLEKEVERLKKLNGDK